jgi:hypothetical protein
LSSSANGYFHASANGHSDTSANGYFHTSANGHSDTSANGHSCSKTFLDNSVKCQ